FRIETLEIKGDALCNIAATGMTADENLVLSKKSTEVAEAALLKGKLAVAKQASSVGLAAAKNKKDGVLVKQWNELRSRIDETSKAFDAAAEAMDVLAKSPDDQSANLAAGKYYCFGEGN